MHTVHILADGHGAGPAWDEGSEVVSGLNLTVPSFSTSMGPHAETHGSYGLGWKVPGEAKVFGGCSIWEAP